MSLAAVEMYEMNVAWMQRTGFLAGFFALAAGIAGCSNGGGDPQCDPACPTFYMCCSASDGIACRDIVNDPNNCGGCGVQCPSGICREAACVPGVQGDGGLPSDGGSGGDCRPACGSTERCCGTTCVSRVGYALGGDGRSDPSFDSCNGCGIACDEERASACSIPGGAAMGAPRCMCGAIQDQCREGELCVSQAGSFTCVSTSNDPRNCGAPGNACAMNESCIGGACQCASAGVACTGGTACCSTGCVDTMTDAANCGSCGNVCGAGETCVAGQCLCGGTEACDRPTSGTFGASCGEICCDGACVTVDEANCGGCGTTCTGEEDICGVPLAIIPGTPAEPPSCGPELGGGFPPTFRTACGGGGGFPGLGDGGLPFP